MMEVRNPAGRAMLDGSLAIPDDAKALVLFAHGSGSSRHSPRNQFVARSLNQAGLGTLLFDLLTPGRGGTHMLFFDPRDTTTNWTPSSADAINLHFLFGSYLRDATEHS